MLGLFSWRLAASSFTIALLLFLILTWIPTFGLAMQIAATASTFTGAFTSVASLLLLALFDADAPTQAYIIVVSLLTGINIALFMQYRLLRRSALPISSAAGAIGFITSILGFGCASCGTLVVSVFLANIGATTVAAVPAIGGYAMQALGITLLAVSTFLLYKKMREPLVC